MTRPAYLSDCSNSSATAMGAFPQVLGCPRARRMSKADFEPVVDACKQFLDLFTCTNADCGAWIEVGGNTR
jgi:hypothetical protein